jgi:signal peptidase II
MQSSPWARLPYLILAGLILFLDRISKSAIVSHFDLGQPVSVIDGVFNITYVQNTGVAFGILDGFSSPVKALFLCLVAGIASLVVVVFSLRNSPGNRRMQAALGMILAGALGNLYDRMRYGYVIDFLELHARGHYWPSFNIADSAISIGVILLAWEMFHSEAPGRA